MCLTSKADKELTDAKMQVSRASRIKKLLQERFDPLDLSVEDHSARHAGHSGARPEGETHFDVRMVSPVFEGMSRVARHRAVTELLSAELDAGLHALSLDLKAPAEVKR